MKKILFIIFFIVSLKGYSQVKCPQVSIFCSDTLQAPIDSIMLVARIVSDPTDPIRQRGWTAVGLANNNFNNTVDSVWVHGIKSTSLYKYKIVTAAGCSMEGYDQVIVLLPIVKPRSVIQIDWNLRKIFYNDGTNEAL